MLNGKDVHKAFVATYPYLQPNWNALKSYSQEGYERVARELNSTLEAQQVSIEAVRCEHCNQMVPAATCKWHPCFVSEGK